MDDDGAEDFLEDSKAMAARLQSNSMSYLQTKPETLNLEPLNPKPYVH